jgi:hypothetical protein
MLVFPGVSKQRSEVTQMEKNNVTKTKSPKEALQEFLDKNPPIYKDAVKWTLLCWNGYRLALLFKGLGPKVDRDSFLRELQEGGLVRLVNDPKGGSEVMVHLTEKGRDEFIDTSYSNKAKKELKRILKIIDKEKKDKDYSDTR